ncbi:hypothetical protein DFH28DRAFT_456710 [Melampsora americana]|nr:hypothetical protein DFH28DRAFT_456710 [Melampsora americana]
MILHIIGLFSFTQLFIISAISAGFWDDQCAGEFFSDIIDSDQIVEISNSQHIHPTQEAIDSVKASEHLLYAHQDLLNGLGDIYLDYYHMPDFNELYHILSSTEKMNEIETETIPDTMQASNILPREGPPSIFQVGNDVNRIHSKELIDSLESARLPQVNSGTIGMKEILPREEGNHVGGIPQEELIESLQPSRQLLGAGDYSDNKRKSHCLTDLELHEKPKHCFDGSWFSTSTPQFPKRQTGKPCVISNQKPPHKHIEIKDRSQDNMGREKSIGISNRKKYQYVHELIFNSVLHWQCKVLLGKRYKMSEEIGSVFIHLGESLTAKLVNHPGFGEPNIKKQLESAIEAIRTNLVMGTLGAVKIIFQKQVGMDLMNSLILDLWQYLLRYLNEELSVQPVEKIKMSPKRKTRQAHTKIEPGKLLEYVLNLAQNRPISSRIIYQKFQEWASTSNYKDVLLNMLPDYWAFVEKCDLIYKLKGDEKTVYSKQFKNRIKDKNQQNIKRSKKVKKTTQKSARLFTSDFVQVIKVEGAYVSKRNEIKNFFSNLHATINSIPKEAIYVKYNPRDFYNGIGFLSKEMVHKAIYKAQDEVTPAFMGLLRLLEPEVKVGLTLDVIYHSGWEFLKGYFSTLIRYFSETKHPIVLRPTVRSRAPEEWSDLKETLHYLSQERRNQIVCQGLIWFLVDLWYDENLNLERNGGRPLGLSVIPTHRKSMIQRFQQLKGRNIC